jgi:hypothetical protein
MVLDFTDMSPCPELATGVYWRADYPDGRRYGGCSREIAIEWCVRKVPSGRGDSPAA